MNASEILDAVAARYATCSSYSDSGQAGFWTIERNRDRICFETKYVRPKQIEYKWQDYGPARGKSEAFSRLTIQGDASRVRYTWKPDIEELSAQSGLSGAGGCSAGASIVVITLLEPSLEGKTYLQLESPELIGTSIVCGNTCRILSGSWFNGDLITLHIEEKELIIRLARRRMLNDYLDSWYCFESVSFDDVVLPDAFVLDT